MDALPDFASLTDDDLDRLIRGTEDEEEAISQRRRRLHARIDALRGERVTRLRGHVAAGTLATPAPESLERPIFEGTGEPPEQGADPPMPVPGELSDDELRSMVFALEQEEDDIARHRRGLPGGIDILGAARERRRRGRHVDPDDLGPILGGPR